MRSNGSGAVRTLTARIDELAAALERLNLADYLSLVQHPWRLVWVNFLAGLARGVGTAVGFAALGTILLAAVRAFIVANLPALGELIADLVRMVELHRAP